MSQLRYVTRKRDNGMWAIYDHKIGRYVMLAIETRVEAIGWRDYYNANPERGD